MSDRARHARETAGGLVATGGLGAAGYGEVQRQKAALRGFSALFTGVFRNANEPVRRAPANVRQRALTSHHNGKPGGRNKLFPSAQEMHQTSLQRSYRHAKPTRVERQRVAIRQGEKLMQRGNRFRAGGLAVTAAGAAAALPYHRKQVVKAAKPGDLRRWGAGLGIGSAAGGGGTYAATQDRKKSEAAVAGGLAGQGAYQSGTYGLKHFAQHQERMADLTRSRKDKALKPVKREHGAFTANMYRHYPKELPGWQANRAAGYVGRGRTGMALGAAATVAGGVAALRHLPPKTTQAKALNLRSLAGYAQRNWRDARIPVAAGGGTAATSAAVDRRHQSRRGATGAVVGAAAAEGAWRGAGLGLTARGHQLERTLPNGMSRSQRTKILRDHRYTFDPPIREGDKKAIAANPRYARQYPKSLPGSGYKRIVGQMSGRRGLALEAATVTTGALAGRKVLHRDKRNGVGKRLVYETDKLSKPRAAEFAAGASLLALGAPRMVGPALSRGAKVAAARGQGKASRALVEAESMRRAWLTGTAPLVNRMPKSLQSPLVATAAGGVLTAHAVPVRRKSYSPVVMP